MIDSAAVPEGNRDDPILVVDDNEWNRDLLSRRLISLGYQVITAVDGVVALEVLEREQISLVLLDIMMPRADGYDVLARMKDDERLQHIPVLVISALEELQSTVACIELGAQDFLTKPYEPVLLRARVSACMERVRLRKQEEQYRTKLEGMTAQLEVRVREQVEEISSGQLAVIFGMSKLAESKDPETGAHLERMREYCKALAQQLRSSEYAQEIDDDFIDTIYAASPLHDIGKVGVPDSILLKPGRLNAEEWKVMQTHTLIGSETLRAVDRQHPGSSLIRMGVEIAEGHHERWDGSGYPRGLSGAQIPLPARILALGDVYDALTSKRCYKEAFTHEKSRSMILKEEGKQFDPVIVRAFLDVEDEFISIRDRYQDEAS